MSGGCGELVLELRQGGGLELAHTLARDAQLLADRLERLGLAADAEPQLDDPPLALGELRDRVAHLAPAERVDGVDLGVGRGLVVEEVAELAVVLRPDRPVERDVRLDRVKRLLDVHEVELRLLRELLARRLASEPRLEPALRPPELHPALVDVRRDADRRGLVRDRPLAGLTDPPGGVGRELEPLAPVELLDGAVQPDHALLDEVQQRQVLPLVALGDRDHQAQVGVDHALLGLAVATLDALRERDLLRRGEQRVAAGAVHEERERIGRARRGGVRDGLLRGRGSRRDDLDLPGLELRTQLGELLLVEVVLERERLQGGLLDRCVLLRFLQERGYSSFQHSAQVLLTSFTSRRCRAKTAGQAFRRQPIQRPHGPSYSGWDQKYSPSRWRFRPPHRLTFRFRVLPSGGASSYSRSVLGASGNLTMATGPGKTLGELICALCEVFFYGVQSTSPAGSSGRRSSRPPRAASSSFEKRSRKNSRMPATWVSAASRSFASPSSVSCA